MGQGWPGTGESFESQAKSGHAPPLPPIALILKWCARPAGLPSSRGYEIWVLWLTRFPRIATAPIFWGWGMGDFQNRPPQCRSSDDPTQLDKPVEVGSVVEHLPHCAVTQRELDAPQLALLGQPVEHVG